MKFSQADKDFIVKELPRYDKVYKKILCTLIIKKAKEIDSKKHGITFKRDLTSREYYFGKE